MNKVSMKKPEFVKNACALKSQQSLTEGVTVDTRHIHLSETGYQASSYFECYERKMY
jgi:hypothetical protein